MRLVAILVFIICAAASFAQNDSTASEEEVFQFVEERAKFPGGDAAFAQYIAKNLKYPELAKKNGIEGKVYVSFTIDTSGLVSNPEIMQKRLSGLDSTQNDYCLGDCAIDVIAKSPRWLPALQRSKKVRMRMIVPISFKLQ
ncbi:energy transducer TonB [Bacteroidia bacterium]|nr:energy transducer TonB [Bacteroidia bacterium]MDA9110616.1 energy transducer TonB [Bacteroidia bacterium]